MGDKNTMDYQFKLFDVCLPFREMHGKRQMPWNAPDFHSITQNANSVFSACIWIYEDLTEIAYHQPTQGKVFPPP